MITIGGVMKKSIVLISLLMVCFLTAGCGTALVVDSAGDEPDINLSDGECKTVNNDCTLRAAIMEANVLPDISEITFDNNISVIYPKTLLPPLTAGNTYIDGDGSVILDGSKLVQNNYGISIDKSGHNIIQGLKIRYFVVGIYIQAYGQSQPAKNNTIGLRKNETNDGSQRNIIILNAHGVVIRGEGASNNLVAGNYIGIHDNGSIAKANKYSGVDIRSGSHDNLIGSLTGNSLAEGGNLISGNGNHGVYIREGSYSNHISGNIIGTNLAGTSAVNNDTGIRISDGSPDNVIGISPSGEGHGNLISGNGYGIELEDSSSTIIAGNLIGTDYTGTSSVSNFTGLILDSAASSVIGTNGDGISDEMEGNLISGNYYKGLEITQGSSNNNIIAGNKIGTDITGINVLANGGSGIISKGDFTRIGTDGDGVSDDLEGNLISGNDGYGIQLSSFGNTISGNIIGLDISGTEILGNGNSGIQIGPNSAQNLIGTDGNGVSDDLERNIISGNGNSFGNHFGIEMETVVDSTIAGNYIGTDISGTIALGIYQHGIYLVFGSDQNVIGTNGDGSADLAEGNLISGNSGFPLQILEGNGNIISGNLIGTDISGTSALPNGATSPDPGYGAVRIGGNNNLVGTNGDGLNDQHEGNLISGNLTSGIELVGENNIIAGNKIGTNISGTAALGNAGYGILSWGGLGNNRIGTDGNGLSDLEEGNFIGANGTHGIIIQVPNCDIAGNFIGTDSSGTIDLGNAGHGIYLKENASGNTIGGSIEKSNVIAYNGLNGIFFSSNISDTALITFNSIYSNEELGIDLSPGSGVTPNDPGDIDSGANALMNYPILLSASSISGYIAINGEMVSSLPYTSYLVQFFENEICDSPSGHGEGKIYIGSSQVWADANGNGAFSVSFSANVPAGHYITATATAYSKTSEFSACVEVTGGESTFSDENPCEQFNQEDMSLTTFQVRPESNLFYLYVKNPEPFPGSIPENSNWEYYANLGDLSAYKCGFEGDDNKVFCYFSIPESYFNTVKPLKLFSNICIPPFYVNEEVSIFTKDPTGPSGTNDPGLCSSDLGPRACPAAGGIYFENPGYCRCPE